MEWFWPKRRVGLGLKLDQNLQVEEVVPGGPCCQSWTSIDVGDILTHVGNVCVTGRKIEDIVQYTTSDEGSKEELKLIRGDETITANIVRIFKQVTPIEKIIQSQVRQGFRRRRPEVIEQVFMKHAIADSAVPNSFHLPKDKFMIPLKEFDVGSKDVNESNVKDLEFFFNKLDINSDGKLDFGEFRAAVQSPSLLEEWVRSLNVHQLVADAIPRKEGENPLKTASDLSFELISKISDGVAEALQEILKVEVARLRASFAKMAKQDENNLALKFQSKSSKMHCGNFEDFHRGLTAHIGSCGLHPFPHVQIR